MASCGSFGFPLLKSIMMSVAPSFFRPAKPATTPLSHFMRLGGTPTDSWPYSPAACTPARKACSALVGFLRDSVRSRFARFLPFSHRFLCCLTRRLVASAASTPRSLATALIGGSLGFRYPWSSLRTWRLEHKKAVLLMLIGRPAASNAWDTCW